MQKNRSAIRPDTEMLWIAKHDAGMQLEISTKFNELGYSLMTVVADEKDESLWVEIEAGDHLFQVPIKYVRDFLNAASEGVHSETWYQRKA